MQFNFIIYSKKSSSMCHWWTSGAPLSLGGIFTTIFTWATKMSNTILQNVMGKRRFQLWKHHGFPFYLVTHSGAPPEINDYILSYSYHLTAWARRQVRAAQCRTVLFKHPRDRERIRTLTSTIYHSRETEKTWARAWCCVTFRVL